MTNILSTLKTSLVLLLVISLQALTEEKEYKFNEEHINLANEVIDILENEHFVKLNFKEIQLKSLKEFLNILDRNHLIFLESEINNFLRIDMLTIENTLESAFSIFNLYSDRYKSRHKHQLQILENSNLLNLNQEKSISLNRKEEGWEKSISDLEQAWTNFITNDLIQLIINGNSLEEAKEKLIKRQMGQLNYFEKTKNEDIFDIFINAVTSRYGPATVYFSPKRVEDFDIDMKLSLEGIGATLSSDGLYTTVRSIIPGGPADKSKLLKAEDKIIGVGQEQKEIKDIIGWRIDDAVRLIRGPIDSNVKLEIIPANALDESETKTITITRGLVKLEDQSAERKTLTIKNNDQEFLIGVIELPAFYMDFDAYQRREYNFKSSSSDVKKLITELKKEKIDGLILDLRNNGGGSLFEANALAHLFLGGGQTVQVKSSSGDIQALGKRRGFQFYGKPLAILVNKFSASASEILAGAIQDYGRGLVLGTETFGKGTVQKMEPLSKGELKYTESKFYRITGNSVQISGISPDVYIPDFIETEEFGMKTLDNALEYDEISPIKFKTLPEVTTYSNLNELASDRVKTSPVFRYISEEKNWREIQKQKNSLILNLETRKKDKKRAENEFLSRHNRFREEMNLNTYKTYKEYLNKEEDEMDLEEEILIEAANILTDQITLSFKPIVFSLDTTT